MLYIDMKYVNKNTFTDEVSQSKWTDQGSDYYPLEQQNYNHQKNQTDLKTGMDEIHQKGGLII